jgi:hypothetical protein
VKNNRPEDVWAWAIETSETMHAKVIAKVLIILFPPRVELPGAALVPTGLFQLPQLLVGHGVLVLDHLAPLLAAAAAQPEDGGLGVGWEIAVVGDFLRLALNLQDLHVGMGKTLGLAQERLGDVAALLHGLPEAGIFSEPAADGGEVDLEQVGEVFVGGAQP